MTEISVPFTRDDLVALKETLDQTKVFEGSDELREAIDGQLQRRGKPGPLHVQVRSLANLARRIVLVDPESVRLRGKIARVLQSTDTMRGLAPVSATDGTLDASFSAPATSGQPPTPAARPRAAPGA